MEEPQEIAAVATQGHPYKFMNSWVKKYFLNYSINGVHWKKYNKVINFSLILYWRRTESTTHYRQKQSFADVF